MIRSLTGTALYIRTESTDLIKKSSPVMLKWSDENLREQLSSLGYKRKELVSWIVLRPSRPHSSYQFWGTISLETTHSTTAYFRFVQSQYLSSTVVKA